MNKSERFLTFAEQVTLFEQRGMIIPNREKAERMLSFISYYKLKEMSLPFLINDKYIENFSFDDMLTRFYENKNLRLNLLRLTEKVELSLKTKIAYILGRKTGAYGYLDFNLWIDKTRYKETTRCLKEKDFKDRITKNIKRSKNELIKPFIPSNKVPIWLLVDVLSFGETLEMYYLIHKKDRFDIANSYNVDILIFISWLKNINMIRNSSAHNSNIIDISFSTKAKIPEYMKSKLYIHTDTTYSNKIAITILILEYLIPIINLKYPGGAIRKNLIKLCKNKSDKEAQRLGFKDFKTIELLKI